MSLGEAAQRFGRGPGGDGRDGQQHALCETVRERIKKVPAAQQAQLVQMLSQLNETEQMKVFERVVRTTA